MPFTLAHPAAILWCARWRASGAPLAAFVIGAMSPDFEYLLRLRTISFYSHTLPGIFTFCVPAGLLVLVVYRSAVEARLRAYLPVYFRRRMAASGDCPPSAGPRVLFLTCAAIAFGALTHILWDGFTHYNGLFARWLPWLRHDISGFAAHRYLQHGSTLCGFLIMAWWFHRRPTGNISGPSREARGFWSVVALTFCLVLATCVRIAPTPGWVTWILCGMNAAGIGLVAGGLWDHLTHRPDLAV